jgi:hypothetical protein
MIKVYFSDEDIGKWYWTYSINDWGLYAMIKNKPHCGTVRNFALMMRIFYNMAHLDSREINDIEHTVFMNYV